MKEESPCKPDPLRLKKGDWGGLKARISRIAPEQLSRFRNFLLVSSRKVGNV